MKEQTIEKFLNATALFAGTDKESARRAARSPLLYARDYVKGDGVTFKGGALAVLVKGKLKVGGRSEIKKLMLAQMEVGAVFGFATLFEEGDAFEPDVRAACASTVLFLPEKLILELIAADPALAKNIISIQSSKIRYLNKKILSYTAPSGAEKLYRYLLTQTPEDDGSIRLSLPAAQLAARLDMGRASLYRAFKALETEGKIERDGDKITLKGEE